MVRIGVCQWSLEARGPDALVRAAELGFSAIHLDGDDLALGDWWPDGPGAAVALEAAAATTGVTIAAVAPGRLNQLGLTSAAGSEGARAAEHRGRHPRSRLARAADLPSRQRRDPRRNRPAPDAEAMQAACDMATRTACSWLPRTR
jgi:sugar phosphate isomerase/epimerase